jgi:hypothetical protein
MEAKRSMSCTKSEFAAYLFWEYFKANALLVEVEYVGGSSKTAFFVSWKQVMSSCELELEH